MTAESKLEAARAKGDLTGAIAALREEARTELANASTPAREEKDVIDGTIALAAHLSAQGMRGADRRQSIGAVKPGTTVTPRGVSKRVLTPEAKHARALEWASSLTEEQRGAFLISDKFEELSEAAQIAIADAFAEADDESYQSTLVPDISNLDPELLDPDAIADEDEVVDDADHDYEALFEQASWEAEQTP